MEVHIKALLELAFPPKPPKFGVKAHIESPTGVALTLFGGRGEKGVCQLQ
jgi:hypothetical protein